jgi:hypothetical protein
MNEYQKEAIRIRNDVLHFKLIIDRKRFAHNKRSYEMQVNVNQNSRDSDNVVTTLLSQVKRVDLRSFLFKKNMLKRTYWV